MLKNGAETHQDQNQNDVVPAVVEHETGEYYDAKAMDGHQCSPPFHGQRVKPKG